MLLWTSEICATDLPHSLFGDMRLPLNLLVLGFTACIPLTTPSSTTGEFAPPMTTTPSVGASAPVSAAGGGDRTQLLMGLRQTGTGSSYTANIGWYVLFDDGHVLAHLPSQGLEGIDKRYFANDLGTYAVSGNTLEMRFQSYHLVFTPRSDGGFDSREGSFWPASSLDGALLEGAYAPRSGPPDIAFSRDGHFKTNGGLLINTGGNGLQPTPAGTGSYRIARNTLTLSYTTGQVVRISATTLHANELPNVSSIFFGGFEYHRI